MFIVKFLLYHFAGEHFLANLDGKRCVELGELCLDESHADALIDAEAVVARRDFDHLFAVHVEHRIAVTWDCFVCEFDADELLRHAVGLLLCEGFLADELRLVELAEHREASHDRRDVCTEFVAIERKAYLEAQGVATAEAAGLAASALDELVPGFLCELMRAVDLEAVLAGVAGAGDDDGKFRK